MKVLFWAVKAFFVCIFVLSVSIVIYWIKEFAEVYIDQFGDLAKAFIIRNALMISLLVALLVLASILVMRRNKKKKILQRDITISRAKLNGFLEDEDIRLLQKLDTIDGLHFDNNGQYIIMFYITEDRFFDPEFWVHGDVFVPRDMPESDDRFVVPVVLKRGDGDLHPLTLGRPFVESCEFVLNLEAVGARSRTVVRCLSIISLLNALHLPFFAFGLIPIIYFIRNIVGYSVESEFDNLASKLFDEDEELSSINHIKIKGYEINLMTIWGGMISYSVERPCDLSKRIDLIRYGLVLMQVLTDKETQLSAILTHSVSKMDKWLEDAAKSAGDGYEAAEDMTKEIEKSVSKSNRN